MNRITTFLTDKVISSRGMSMAMWAFVFALNFLTGWANTNPAISWINFLCAGLAIGGLLHAIVMPGIFSTWGEIEKATMRAQMEKSIEEAWADFQRQHPDQADAPPPRMIVQ